MKKIAQLLNAMQCADEAVIRELKLLYPEGSAVRVCLMQGQITPSNATVISHPGGKFGYVRVRLSSKKQAVRDVTPNDIL